jgi:glyoxylase-like metal-dependent hydrolase (beta-lactamase superfamily II)
MPGESAMTTNETPATYWIGSASVIKIPELEIAFPASTLLPDYDPGQALPLDGSRADDPGSQQLTVSIHSWLVRVGGQTVLVDAGVGNGKARAAKAFDQLDTPWLDRLAAAGVRPGDVTHVLLTHLHTDHVGWNTVPEPGGWRPTFPNARTLLPQRGYELFTAPDNRSRPNYDMFADSVLPVVQAGRVELVPSEVCEALPGFKFLPTPHVHPAALRWM